MELAKKLLTESEAASKEASRRWRACAGSGMPMDGEVVPKETGEVLSRLEKCARGVSRSSRALFGEVEKCSGAAESLERLARREERARAVLEHAEDVLELGESALAAEESAARGDVTGAAAAVARFRGVSRRLSPPSEDAARVARAADSVVGELKRRLEVCARSEDGRGVAECSQLLEMLGRGAEAGAVCRRAAGLRVGDMLKEVDLSFWGGVEDLSVDLDGLLGSVEKEVLNAKAMEETGGKEAAEIVRTALGEIAEQYLPRPLQALVSSPAFTTAVTQASQEKLHAGTDEDHLTIAGDSASKMVTIVSRIGHLAKTLPNAPTLQRVWKEMAAIYAAVESDALEAGISRAIFFEETQCIDQIWTSTIGEDIVFVLDTVRVYILEEVDEKEYFMEEVDEKL